MPESTRLVDLVQAQIDRFLQQRSEAFRSISPALASMMDVASSFLSGGKRFRALFCYWGWFASGAANPTNNLLDDATSPDFDSIVLAASALEMFHAAALVHDDIMDRSDLRRGAASAHRQFEEMHRGSGWNGDDASFGLSAALLLGDLLLGWSDELFDEGTAGLSSTSAARAARGEFARMRTEVTAGQYLDIVEEHSWTLHPEEQALPRAHRVIVFKSAKYSVEAPLAIGAALGSASAQQIAALRAYGLPLGVAFQLRDDLLGVFGDPSVTGKPAGDDLREGKRTVLVAVARGRLSTSSRRLVDEMLGDPTLNAQQVEVIRRSFVDCGAVSEVERIIDYNVGLAIAAIRDSPVRAVAKTQLLSLASEVTSRTS